MAKQGLLLLVNNPEKRGWKEYFVQIKNVTDWNILCITLKVFFCVLTMVGRNITINVFYCLILRLPHTFAFWFDLTCKSGNKSVAVLVGMVENLTLILALCSTALKANSGLQKPYNWAIFSWEGCRNIYRT